MSDEASRFGASDSATARTYMSALPLRPCIGSYGIVDTSAELQKTVKLYEDENRRLKELLQAKGTNLQDLHKRTPISSLQRDLDNAEQQLREERNRHLQTKDSLKRAEDNARAYQEGFSKCGTSARYKLENEDLKRKLAIRDNDVSESRRLIEEFHRLEQKSVVELIDERNAKEQAALLERVAKMDEIEKELGAVKLDLAEERAKAVGLITRDDQIQKDLDAKAKELEEVRAQQLKEMEDLDDSWRAKEAQRNEDAQKKLEEVTARMPKQTSDDINSAITENTESSVDAEKMTKLKTELRTLKHQNKDLQDEIQLLRKGAYSEKDMKKVKDSHAHEIKRMEDKINLKDAENAELTHLLKQCREDLEKIKVEMAKADAKELQKKLSSALTDMEQERREKRKFKSDLEDMRGQIRVFCRMRPVSAKETKEGDKVCARFQDDYTIQLTNPEKTSDERTFVMNRCFTDQSTQEQVYEEVEKLVFLSMEGYNVCIFAYGQTGSGKTHTMIGNPETDPGIALRAFRTIFSHVDQTKNKFNYEVKSYMVELYNDKLLDLLSKGGTHKEDMDIKKDAQGVVFIPGIQTESAKSADDLFKVFNLGTKNRHTAATKMNSESSRSHLILSILIEASSKQTQKCARGKFSIIDLAGSERQSKTQASGIQLEEAKSINRSLSALGDVIASLQTQQKHIPYRNNKLTRLMEDSLGGNAKTCMFVNISPADSNFKESTNSLVYAQRVKCITNVAKPVSDSKEIARLKNIIARLKKGEQIEDTSEVATGTS